MDFRLDNYFSDLNDFDRLIYDSREVGDFMFERMFPIATSNDD